MNDASALAVLAFDGIAGGTRAADAMLKRAPLDLFRAGTVHPGCYLVLLGGSVAAVDEAYVEGLRVGAETLTDQVLLPDVHPQVFAAVGGKRRTVEGDTLGILELSGLAATILAADRARKTAEVEIVEIRLGDGLGGKGLVHLTGTVHDVQAALEAGAAAVVRPGLAVAQTIIPVLDDVLRRRINGSTRFFDESGG